MVAVLRSFPLVVFQTLVFVMTVVLVQMTSVIVMEVVLTQITARVLLRVVVMLIVTIAIPARVIFVIIPEQLVLPVQTPITVPVLLHVLRTKIVTTAVSDQHCATLIFVREVSVAILITLALVVTDPVREMRMLLIVPLIAPLPTNLPRATTTASNPALLYPPSGAGPLTPMSLPKASMSTSTMALKTTIPVLDAPMAAKALLPPLMYPEQASHSLVTMALPTPSPLNSRTVNLTESEPMPSMYLQGRILFYYSVGIRARTMRTLWWPNAKIVLIMTAMA